MTFNGDDDYIEFEVSESFQTITHEFTLEALLKLTSYGDENSNALFMMSTSTPTLGGHENILALWASATTNENNIAVAIFDSEGIYHAIHLNYKIELNQLVLIDIVGNHEGILSLYINGTYIESDIWNSPLIMDSLHSTYLGTDIDANGSKTDFFNGLIDHARIYNVALSSNEISNNFISLTSIDITTASSTTTSATTESSTTPDNSTEPYEFDLINLLPVGVTVGSFVIIIVMGVAICRNREK
ncbi:MAG: LamG domain-containing protein [Candidatus Thorarchaeota archaeon]